MVSSAAKLTNTVAESPLHIGMKKCPGPNLYLISRVVVAINKGQSINMYTTGFQTSKASNQTLSVWFLLIGLDYNGKTIQGLYTSPTQYDINSTAGTIR